MPTGPLDSFTIRILNLAFLTFKLESRLYGLLFLSLESFANEEIYFDIGLSTYLWNRSLNIVIKCP